jgi:hypothetical protein
MSRQPRDLTFRRSDFVRAVKAAKSAGVDVARYELSKEGSIIIIPGKPPDVTSESTTPLEAWKTMKHARKAEGDQQ